MGSNGIVAIIFGLMVLIPLYFASRRLKGKK